MSDEMRAELAAIDPHSDCDRRAELSGLFHTAGSFHLRGHGQVAVHLDVASSAVARRAFSLLRALGVQAEIRTYRRHAFDKGTRYQLHVEGGWPAIALLREAGVLSSANAPLERPPKRVVARACCRRAYLRGVLLGAGSLTSPRALHLEIRTPERGGAEFVAEVAAREEIPLRVIERTGHAAVYAKSAETIADLLAAAGAGDTALTLNEHVVVAGARAHANRLANADHANIVRASRAAHAQLQAVRALERRGLIARLSRELQEIAELRVKHPALPLRELAAKCRPPTTKAAAHRRLVKLVRLADDR